MTAPLPYSPEELETLRNGSQYQTRQNARWFATLAAKESEKAAAIGPCDDCGQAAGIRVCTGCWEKAKAAAVAAAREEQREACARSVRLVGRDDCVAAVRAQTLTATPLADRIAELEERMNVVLHAGPSTALAVSVFDRAEKAEAERDAWKAKAIRDPSQLAETLWSECYADLAAANVQNIAERDALRAQVAKLAAQTDPLHINDASFAVHAALGWGFDPNTVSPVSLARAAEALSIECMGLRAQVAKMEAQAKEDGAAVARCLLVNERLRAQVEEARARLHPFAKSLCDDSVAGYVCACEQCLAFRFLAAMDGAKP